MSAVRLEKYRTTQTRPRHTHSIARSRCFKKSACVQQPHDSAWAGRSEAAEELRGAPCLERGLPARRQGPAPVHGPRVELAPHPVRRAPRRHFPRHVCEAVEVRELHGLEHLAAERRDLRRRVPEERRDAAARELRGLRVRRELAVLRLDRAGPQRDDVHVVAGELLRHVRAHAVQSGLPRPVAHVEEVPAPPGEEMFTMSPAFRSTMLGAVSALMT